MSNGIVVYHSDGSEELLLPSFSRNRVANQWFEARRRSKRRPRVPSKEKATKLHFFDFDHTLFRSPGPIGGQVKEKDPHHPERRPSIDSTDEWFDESLSGRIPPIPNDNWWIQETVKRFKEAQKDPRSRVVLVTGRYPEFEGPVRRLLKSQDLEPDDVYLKDPEVYGKHGRTTQAYKAQTMKDVLSEMPGVKSIHLYDDKDISYEALEQAAHEMGHERVQRHELPEHEERDKQIEKYGWNRFLCEFWECGKKKVKNTHRDTADKYPEVTTWTLMKNDENFRQRIIDQYKYWVSIGAPDKKRKRTASRVAARWLLAISGSST